MTWAALQEAIIAGNKDAEAVASRCMHGRDADAARQHALESIFHTEEMPDSMRALLAPRMQPAAADGQLLKRVLHAAQHVMSRKRPTPSLRMTRAVA